MENRKEIQSYFKKEYYNKNKNYKAILSEIREDKKMKINKLLKTISTAILTLLGATSIVFASTQIYNNYIKEKSSVSSAKTFGFGESYIDDESVISIDDMLFYQDSKLHYKIITNMEDYTRYKKRIDELPNMTEDSFNENFLIVLANTFFRQPHEKDLDIYEITSDETTTHIIMKQKDNPDYNKKTNVWYAVVDKSLLRENIKLTIEQNYIENPNFMKLSELPDDYSIDDAIKDGCFVEDKYKVLSDNIYAMDEFLEKAEKNEIVIIRIYLKYEEYIRIIDLEYKNEIFTINAITSEDNDVFIGSYHYMKKDDEHSNGLVEYEFLENDDNGNKIWWESYPFLTIYQ